MIKTDKIFSFLIILLLIASAAIIVNKSIFGHSIAQQVYTSDSIPAADAITIGTDGAIIIHTAQLPGTISGYAGAVPLDIYITEGKVSEIKALSNEETPSFFNRASKIISQWIGKTPREAEELKVDAVSGATFTSTAIINNVGVGLSYYQGTQATAATPSSPVKIWIALLVTLAACIVPLCVKNKLYHNIQLIANIIVLGFWCGQFLDYALILKYTSFGFTWPTILVAVTMLIAAFIYPLFGKPQYYCTHICPLGSAQQLMGQICGYKIKITPRLLKGLDWFRKILWAALMLCLWTDCLTQWMDLELFQAFQFQSASWGIIIAACILVALSIVVNRPYCRFVCPTGSLFKRSENIG